MIETKDLDGGLITVTARHENGRKRVKLIIEDKRNPEAARIRETLEHELANVHINESFSDIICATIPTLVRGIMRKVKE